MDLGQTVRSENIIVGEKKNNLSIVIPVYNEQANIEPLTREIADLLNNLTEEYLPVEVVFVDDGSIDGTQQKLKKVTTDYSFVKSLHLSRNFGQTAALAAGIEESTGKFIVTMDGDLQNNPDDIPRLLSTLEEGYDCVSGWRIEREDPLTKRIPSKFQTYLANLTGPDIHDFGCTLKAYRGNALEDINLYGEGHRYIPAKLFKQGYQITEIEVDHRPRAAGRTKYGVKRLVKGFVDLVFHIFWNRYSTRPLHVLGGGGLMLLGAGLVIGTHAVFTKLFFGAELLSKTPRLLLTIAFVLFGLQLIMFGFLAEMLIKIHYADTSEFRISQIHEGQSQ